MCAKYLGYRNSLDVTVLCTYIRLVLKTDRINFRLGPELRSALQLYTQRYDRSEAEAIREAVWLFLESKGYGRLMRKGAKKR